MTTIITKRLDYLRAAEPLLSTLGPIEYCDDQSPETILAAVAGAEIVLATKGCVIDGAVMDAAPGLKIIAAPTAGFEWIDVDAATARGIPVVANTGAASDAVAEFALGAVLALSRRIVEADRMMRTNDFVTVRDHFARADARAGFDLSESTVAVIGLGHIGLRVAGLLGVLRPKALIGFDPFAAPDRAKAAGVELHTDLAECLRRANIVLLHVPLTAETRHLINDETLGLMPPGSYLVNCSRGEVVSEAALLAALESGRLAGAALDVFEQEPLPADSILRSLDNVILTPHIAGVTAQSDATRAREIAERIVDCTEGRRPVGLVNPAVWLSRRTRTEETAR